MRRIIHCGLLTLVSWLAASLASAQSMPVEQLWSPEPPLLQYSTVDGMSQGDVLAIAQDQSGHLWIATHRGLNRFDGSEFLNFTKADGLLHNHVTALYAASDGRIWFSDVNGNLLTIDNNAVNHVIKLAGFESTVIVDIAEFDGQLVLATRDAGVYLYAPDTVGASPTLLRGSEERTRDLAVRDGTLWFVQDAMLFRWAGGDAIPQRLDHDKVIGSTGGEDGSYWVVTEGGDIERWFQGRVLRRYQMPEDQVFSNIVSDGADSVWVGTREGFYGYRVEPAASSNGRVVVSAFDNFSQINTLYVDRENTLWVGRYGGLFRHLGHRFQHFKNRYSSDSNIIWSITQDVRNNFYFGTNAGVLKRSPGGETVDYSKQVGMPGIAYRDVVAAKDGAIYAATIDAGIYAVDTVNHQATLLPGTAELIVLDLELDREGWLWAATDGAGMVRIDPAGVVEASSFEQTLGGAIYSLSIDPAGNVWYGMDAVGLGVLKPAGEGAFSHDFFGAEIELDRMLFSHILAVGEGQLWLAGEDSQLVYFDNGDTRDYTRDSPMRDQNVYSVFVNEDGTLLLGGEKGVFLFDTETMESRGFGPLHGFLGMEVNAHANFVDQQGYLWFGTVDGPTRMDLRQPLSRRVPIQPRITSAKIQNSNAFMLPQQELAYHERDVQFNFTDVSLSEPFGIQYSYRLVGRDNEWSAPSRTRSVNYSGLVPGSYKFEVRARYTDDTWYANPNALEFTVRAPFWRTPWFLAAATLCVALFLYLCIWLRTRGIERLNLRLREEVEERTRSIEEGRERLLESNRQLVAESEERRRANQARAEVETRFRVAFQSTPIGMALVDIKGRVLNSNQALRRMFLAPAMHEDEEASVNALSFVDEEEKQTMWADFERLIKGEIDSFDAQYKCRRFDNSVLHTHMFLTAVRDEDTSYQYCIAQVQDVTESRRLNDALEYQANYDELSGLLNRRSFERALSRAYAQSLYAKSPSYLMFMDLDQFKVVNDTSGHSAGDELLRQLSEVIRDEVRNDDTVGRLGGDEFGLILWNCPTNVAYRIAESIRAAIEDFQFQWEANTYRVGVSIGAVVIDQSLGTTAELQQLADAACYHSKDHGRNRVHFVQEEGESINEQRGEVRWLQRLHEAMDSSNFALYGQLIKPVDPESREPERMEILLRMRDPHTRKIIPPGAFLPAAERYGLITKLDQWVVENLLRMLYVHQAVGSTERRYWINLSGTSVGDKRFVDFLIDAVKSSGLPPGMINFEITETAVIRNVGEAGRMMSALHDMGCQFALDDFGSGLSSFGYLKKLPVDFIKIDGMFVRDILTDDIDRVFVRSIIDISRTMGIKSIAEFVENTKILEAVRDLGVDYVQGFGVHRPEAIFADLRPGSLVGANALPTVQTLPLISKEKRA